MLLDNAVEVIWIWTLGVASGDHSLGGIQPDNPGALPCWDQRLYYGSLVNGASKESSDISSQMAHSHVPFLS